jgi:outer membrane protein assembly complex protein YaeT
MQKHRKIVAAIVVWLIRATTLRPQDAPVQPSEAQLAANAGTPVQMQHAIVGEITFAGLRRISPEALKPLLTTCPLQSLEMVNVTHDVRALARIGWFETVQVDAREQNPPDISPTSKRTVRLTFYVPELPFVTDVEYHGSHLLSSAQIEKLLAEKKLIPKLGEPENKWKLDLASKAIESALADLAYPHSHVRIVKEESAQATVHVRFQIDDGPHVPVGRLVFEGDPAIKERLLARQMRRVSPRSFFASARGKDAYSLGRFEEDRERLLSYYQNHGYPQARIGPAQIAEYTRHSRRWLPWSHPIAAPRIALSIPIQAGAPYRMKSVDTSEALKAAAGVNQAKTVPANLAPEQAYSAQAVENLRRAWESLVRGSAGRKIDKPIHNVEVMRTFDAQSHTAKVRLDLSSEPAYNVSRLEFRGLHRFPDRYFRQRLGVHEGAPLDDRALEAGLRRLARTGYFKPLKKEDVEVVPNDEAKTLNVTIHIEELGLQRVSMVGGRGQFGSTLGIAYSLFNILDREELLTSKIEGGPESLQLALGFAKEAFLGSRGSLAFSVFDTFLRPRLSGSLQGPFYEQRTQGVTADWSYSLSNSDALSTTYTLSHSLTSYPLQSPTGPTSLASSDVRTESSSHSVGEGWTRDTGNQRILVADSVSGGWLGGSENVLRSKVEYARLVRDPILDQHNAWAFRSVFTGVGSYAGNMPLTDRLFAGDAYVRGLRDGELGPSALALSTSPTRASPFFASPAGANLIGAMNAEYRVHLNAAVEAAGFFDLGAGLLLPNWLGASRPSLIDYTNGALHGSTGVELRWTLPAIGVPLRAYYALNLLRLNRPVLMPDASIFRIQNRLASFGWGLGSLF